jgi:hypothetical protein
MSALSAARLRARFRHNPRVQVQLDPDGRGPAPDERFDLVVCLSVLHSGAPPRRRSTAMSGVLALVSVAVGGGGSMLYLGGTDADRQAVRSQRVLAVLPALVIAALAVLAVYGPRGYPAVALLATAATFVANNLAELPLAQLHRDLRFHLIAAPTLAGKVWRSRSSRSGCPSRARCWSARS